MKKTIYTVTIEVEKSTHDVFDHVIRLSKWWPEDYVGESLKLNSEFVLQTGDSHYSKNKVIEFIPDKKFGWITIGCPAPGCLDNMSFRICYSRRQLKGDSN